MSVNDEIVPILERVLKDRKQAIAVAAEIATALDLGGWITTDNDHLAMMRTALRVVHAKVVHEDTSSRDLAALTNRFQTLSKEVTTMEERQNQEKPKGGSKSDNADAATGSAGDKRFDPTEV